MAKTKVPRPAHWTLEHDPAPGDLMLIQDFVATAPLGSSPERLATPQTFEERIQLTGIVEAVNDITISAEAGGRVGYVAKLGTEVVSGTVVARFDERVMKSQAAAAEAEYRLADDTFRRQEALYADSVISALEFDNARTRRDQTAASNAQAQKMLDDTQLKSPITGRVEAKYVEEGELVNPGTPVVRIVDTRPTHR